MWNLEPGFILSRGISLFHLSIVLVTQKYWNQGNHCFCVGKEKLYEIGISNDKAEK